MGDRHQEGSADARGPAERLLHLGESLFSIFLESTRTRFELLSVELAVERSRLLRLLIIGLILAIAVLLGLAFASFLVIVYFWETYRLTAIAGVTVIYGVIALSAGLSLRHILGEAPIPFANTRDTLARDVTALRTRMRQSQGDDATGSFDSRDVE